MDEEDYLMLSGVQHFAFCKRQWALIHIEEIWEDNDLTASGKTIHSNVDDGIAREKRGNITILRSLRISTARLGLSGMCDVVEIIDDGIEPGGFRIFPVEYKHGFPKKGDCDRIQLCAQAMALEEMFNKEVLEGAIYYHMVRRREIVQIDEALRLKTQAAAEEMHAMFRSQTTPPPVYGQQCLSCSLHDICMPSVLSRRPSVETYMAENHKRLER